MSPHEEARARIIWGESPGEVRQWLIGEGLTGEQADVLIRDVERERAGEIRRSGFRRIWIGILLMLGGLALLIALGFLPVIPWMALVAAGAMVLIGLNLLITGIVRLVGGRASGSLTDLD